MRGCVCQRQPACRPRFWAVESKQRKSPLGHDDAAEVAAAIRAPQPESHHRRRAPTFAHSRSNGRRPPTGAKDAWETPKEVLRIELALASTEAKTLRKDRRIQGQRAGALWRKAHGPPKPAARSRAHKKKTYIQYNNTTKRL